MREMGFMEKLLDGAHVEWKSLASICKIETGKLNANAATEDGAYMFFTTAKEVSKIPESVTIPPAPSTAPINIPRCLPTAPPIDANDAQSQ